MRDALLLIARSAGGAMQRGRMAPVLQTPSRPNAALDAAPQTPMASVKGLLPPPSTSPRSPGTAASSAGCAAAIANRFSSSAAGAALLKSPDRCRQTALTNLQAAKAEMAGAVQQLRACACELRIQLPADSVGVVDSHSP